MDPQSRDGLITIAVAVALALLRPPRGRRLLALLKAALIGVVVGELTFLGPQVFLQLTHPRPADDMQRWLLKLGVGLGVFYGVVLASNVMCLVFVVKDLLWWRQCHRQRLNTPPEMPPTSESEDKP